jgi:hypothetical protein
LYIFGYRWRITSVIYNLIGKVEEGVRIMVIRINIAQIAFSEPRDAERQSWADNVVYRELKVKYY